MYRPKPFPVEFYSNYMDELSTKIALARYTQICQKCGKDKGHSFKDWPCPYCHGTGKVQEITVKNKPNYTKIEPARVQVKEYESESTPGLKYQVYATKSGVFSHCSCPGFFFRKECWHKADFLSTRKKGKKCRTPSN